MVSEIAFQLLLLLFQDSQSMHSSPMVISSLGFTLQSSPVLTKIHSQALSWRGKHRKRRANFFASYSNLKIKAIARKIKIWIPHIKITMLWKVMGLFGFLYFSWWHYYCLFICLNFLQNWKWSPEIGLWCFVLHFFFFFFCNIKTQKELI